MNGTSTARSSSHAAGDGAGFLGRGDTRRAWEVQPQLDEAPCRLCHAVGGRRQRCGHSWVWKLVQKGEILAWLSPFLASSEGEAEGKGRFDEKVS